MIQSQLNISKLSKYILNEHSIKNALAAKIDFKKNIFTPKKPNLNKYHVFVPYEMDSLFWILYIINNSDIQYEMMERKGIVMEKSIKITYIENIRKEKKLLKQYKFQSLPDLENNLANENALSIESFLSLCVLDNLNIRFIYKETFFDLQMNDSNSVALIYEVGKKYGVKISTYPELNAITKDFYKISDISKPIKGASSYKLPEIISIAEKLKIDQIDHKTLKKKNKTQLYEEIKDYFIKKKNEL